MTMIFDAASSRMFVDQTDPSNALAIHERLTTLRSVVNWETAAIIVAGIWLLSWMRTAYYRLTRSISIRYNDALHLVPFKYFLVSTSSSVFLYGLAALIVAASVRYGELYQAGLERLAGSVYFLAFVVIFCFANYVALRNRQGARLELYGSRWLSFMFDISLSAILLGLLFLVRFIA